MSQTPTPLSTVSPAAPANASGQAVPAALAPGADLPAELRNARAEGPQAPQVQVRQHHGIGRTLGRIALGAGRALLAVGSLGLTELTLFLIRRAGRAAAPAPRAPAPAVPQAAPTAAQSNSGIMTAIRKGEALPAAYQAAVDEALAELHDSFGSIVPADVTLSTLPSRWLFLSSLQAQISHLGEELQPAQLKAFIMDAATPHIRREAVARAADVIFDEVGYNSKGSLRVDFLLRTIPGLQDALNSAENDEQLSAAIEAAKDGIRAFAEMSRDLVSAEAHGRDEAVRLLSEGLGVSEDAVRQTVKFNKLKESFTYLSAELSCAAPRLSVEEMNRRFAAKAASFAEKKLALYYLVDELGLSPRLADGWKTSILATSTLSDPDMFRPMIQAARTVDAQPALDAIRLYGRDVNAEMVYARLETLCVQLNEALVEAYGGEKSWKALGGDGISDARFFSAQAMLDAVPGLREALSGTPGLLEELKSLAAQHSAFITDVAIQARSLINQQGAARSAQNAPERVAMRHRAEIDIRSAAFSGNVTQQMDFLLLGLDGVSPQNAELARGIGAPENLPFAHRQALNAAIAEARILFGMDSLPEDFREASLPGYHAATLGSLLSSRVARAAVPLSASQVAAMAQELLGVSASARVGRTAIIELAGASGVSVSETAAGDIFAMLIKRHPEAGAALHQSDAATVRGFIESVKNDVEAALAIRRALDEGRADVVRRLAHNTHHSEDDMRQLLHGELFRALDVMWKDAMNDAGAGNDFPGVEEARAAVFERTDAIFLDKYQTWRGMVALDLSGQLLQEWQTRTLSSPRRGELSEFQDACAIGSAVDAQGFATALAQPNLSIDELTALFISVTRRLDHEFLTVLADKYDSMDPIATEREVGGQAV
ncbi:hypothetical protein, partial [Mailhella sp.]|uniref:hypothetical protein n=1 Tax=Mailhella sp. TaxID=1981029 RepID=UPI004063AAE4